MCIRDSGRCWPRTASAPWPCACARPRQQGPCAGGSRGCSARASPCMEGSPPPRMASWLRGCG
eukprot:1821215-Alexandrium_andersonii.AAC.1